MFIRFLIDDLGLRGGRGWGGGMQGVERGVEGLQGGERG